MLSYKLNKWVKSKPPRGGSDLEIEFRDHTPYCSFFSRKILPTTLCFILIGRGFLTRWHKYRSNDGGLPSDPNATKSLKFAVA